MYKSKRNDTYQQQKVLGIGGSSCSAQTVCCEDNSIGEYTKQTCPIFLFAEALNRITDFHRLHSNNSLRDQWSPISNNYGLELDLRFLRYICSSLYFLWFDMLPLIYAPMIAFYVITFGFYWIL